MVHSDPMVDGMLKWQPQAQMITAAIREEAMGEMAKIKSSQFLPLVMMSLSRPSGYQKNTREVQICGRCRVANARNAKESVTITKTSKKKKKKCFYIEIC
jgi:hypothetical protein